MCAGAVGAGGVAARAVAEGALGADGVAVTQGWSATSLIVDSGTCTGWIQRSENGGGWTRITSIHTAPSNGGDATTYTYWDGVGAKAQVCVDDNGSVVCSAPF